jgi:hypothetical protein
LRVHAVFGLGFGFLCMMNAWGCGDSSDDPESSARRSGPGESCQQSSDCRAPLGCFAGVCATAPAQLIETGKVCKAVDCMVADDCCTITQTAAQCQAWKADCATGTQSRCDSYSKSCTCERWECSAGKCQPKAPCSASDDGCILLGLVCNGAKCVQCLKGSDCPPDAKCVDQKCERTCKSNRDCDYLFECQGGACVKVGCKTDRECIALEANDRAVCHSGQCSVPCEASQECRSDDFPLKLMACVGKVCVDVGCASDEECRIRLNQHADAGTKNALCVPSTP